MAKVSKKPKLILLKKVNKRLRICLKKDTSYYMVLQKNFGEKTKRKNKRINKKEINKEE